MATTTAITAIIALKISITAMSGADVDDTTTTITTNTAMATRRS
jgi:hypothetical protein